MIGVGSAVRTLLFSAAAGLPVAWLPQFAPAAAPGMSSAGPIELETQSEYSHIRIRKRGTVRTLIFVRDSGEEAAETRLDLQAPHHLLATYTQFMFASYLFHDEPERVLMVGLGGGAMVRFLQHHEPDVRIDAVEIDPVIVKLADEFFETRSGEMVNIITADGLEYLQETDRRYDVIYLDAFLKPSAETDSTGVPARLKTLEFYGKLRRKLSPNGLVVFNLNRHRATAQDLRTIRTAFAQVYVFRVPGSSNFVAVGSSAERRKSAASLMARARQLDRRFQANFSFETIAKNRVR
jgi:spermidine synthase